MADWYSTLVSYRWHTDDHSAPKITGDTLNKRWLLSTLTVCYESVIKVHLLLWFAVWAGSTEMTTLTRIRTSLCGLRQSQRHTHTHTNTHHKVTHSMPNMSLYFHLQGSWMYQHFTSFQISCNWIFRQLWFCKSMSFLHNNMFYILTPVAI